MTAETGPPASNATEPLAVRMIPWLLIVMAVGVFVLLVVSVNNTPTIVSAMESGDRGKLILEFLDAFGIVAPLVMIGFSIAFIQLAFQMYRRDLTSAAWTQQIFFWLFAFSVIGLALVIFNAVWSRLNPELVPSANLLPNVVAFILVGAIFFAVWRWLVANRKDFYFGEETLAARNSLLAWNLLLPTVIILLLVAARPLERTFIASLTNRVFAAGAGAASEVQFVGLRNYTQLLGFRVDFINCVTDEESGGCAQRTVEEEFETTEIVTIDLDSMDTIPIAELDVVPGFFTTEATNTLLQDSDAFRTGMEAAALEELSENEEVDANSVEAVEFVEPGILQVRINGTDETVDVEISTRLTEIEGLDLSEANLTYAEDVRLEGLNTNWRRSRMLRDGLGNYLAQEFDVEGDATLDDAEVAQFTDLTTLEVTVTHVERREETEFPRPGDVLGASYTNYGPVDSATIGNRQLVFSARDVAFFDAVGNTLFFTFVSVLVELVLGMAIALAVNTKFAGRGLMRAAMLVPWAIPTVISARLWEVMLRDNRSGVINDFLMRIGIVDTPIAWLADPDFQIWGLIFVDVWKTTPFIALLLLAGLQTIPQDIYEAANVDGANKFRQFFSMTLPLLRPTIAVALVFRTLDAVRAFDVFDVLVGQQLQSLATYNQFVLVETREFGYASAVGVTIFVIILIFTVVYVRSLGVETQ